MSELSPPLRWKDPNLPPNAPGLSVQFKEEAEKNEAFTLQNGYDTFDNVLIALVGAIGSKSNATVEIERRLPDGKMKVNQLASRKYESVLKMYKDVKEGREFGTPLREIGIDPGQIATLKAKGIPSVEMLADISDHVGDNLMGYRELKSRAIKFLELREKNAPTVRLELEIAKKDEQLASLQRQLDDLKAAVESQPEKRGPGRPRKVIEQEEDAA